MRPFRLLSTPPATAAWNMALDTVLLDRCSRGQSPPTIRFLAMEPQAVLVGAYQSVADEVRVDYCRDHGIDINRRVTGGGAIFFDTSQLGWEVVCPFSALGLPSRPSERSLARLADPAVAFLRELGLDARYRPRNDIEVGGKKISGTGGTDLRGALLFQGTLLVDFDVETMVRALRVPVEKLRRQEIDGLRERVTWLTRELGQAPSRAELESILARSFEKELGIELTPEGLDAQESRALDQALSAHESDAWILERGRAGGRLLKALFPTDGGVVRALVRTGADPDRILSVHISGDFFVYPGRAIFDLEARLKLVAAKDIRAVVHQFFERHEVTIPGVGPEGISQALLEALSRHEATDLGLEPEQLNQVFPLCSSYHAVSQSRPSHLLLPYCAKPVSCALRHEDSCDGCGECTVGAAYEAGEAQGLTVVTITSFEHLMETLSRLKEQGASAFVGSCCEAFFIKHRKEMESVGLKGLLFDVAGAETCYDLGKSSFAYAGQYEGETEVDLPLLDKILDACARHSR